MSAVITCTVHTSETQQVTDATHTFRGRLSGTTRVSLYQKGKTNLDFTEARDSEWQWHQLSNMHVCTSLQTDNHARTPPLSFYRPDVLPAAQPTASKHWRRTLHPSVICLVVRGQASTNDGPTCSTPSQHNSQDIDSYYRTLLIRNPMLELKLNPLVNQKWPKWVGGISFHCSGYTVC